MWNFKQIAIVFLLIFSTASLHARSEKGISFLPPEKETLDAPPTRAGSCQDFLADWGQKPSALEFIDCQNLSEPLGDRAIALYRVKGADAAAVEALLEQKFRMAPLTFRDGVWQPAVSNDKGEVRSASGEFVDDEGRLFEIVMASEETALARRQDWDKVSQFKVRVIEHLEMPQLEN